MGVGTRTPGISAVSQLSSNFDAFLLQLMQWLVDFLLPVSQLFRPRGRRGIGASSGSIAGVGRGGGLSGVITMMQSRDVW